MARALSSEENNYDREAGLSVGCPILEQLVTSHLERSPDIFFDVADHASEWLSLPNASASAEFFSPPSPLSLELPVAPVTTPTQSSMVAPAPTPAAVQSDLAAPQRNLPCFWEQSADGRSSPLPALLYKPLGQKRDQRVVTLTIILANVIITHDSSLVATHLRIADATKVQKAECGLNCIQPSGSALEYACKNAELTLDNVTAPTRGGSNIYVDLLRRESDGREQILAHRQYPTRSEHIKKRWRRLNTAGELPMAKRSCKKQSVSHA